MDQLVLHAPFTGENQAAMGCFKTHRTLIRTHRTLITAQTTICYLMNFLDAVLIKLLRG